MATAWGTRSASRARIVIDRRYVIAAPLLIAAIDGLFALFDPPLLVAGLLDETAHVATATLVLAALPFRYRPAFLVGVLAGVTLIDIDHIPSELGWWILAAPGYRPVTHSTLTILLAMVIAGSRFVRGPNRALGYGVAAGIGLHLLRDMATGGVLLWWPANYHEVEIAYPLYALTLTVATALAAGRLHALRRPHA